MNMKMTIAVAAMAACGFAGAEEATATSAAPAANAVIAPAKAEGAAPTAQEWKHRRMAEASMRERPLMMAFTKETKPEEVEAFKKSVLEKIDKLAAAGEGQMTVLTRDRARAAFRPRPPRPQPQVKPTEEKPAEAAAK